MAIEVETHRSARERMNEWESEQFQVWGRLETLAFVYNEFANLDDLDDDDLDDRQ